MRLGPQYFVTCAINVFRFPSVTAPLEFGLSCGVCSGELAYGLCAHASKFFALRPAFFTAVMKDIGVGTGRFPPGLSFPSGAVKPQPIFSLVSSVEWTPT